jgi:hypothetical protein
MVVIATPTTRAKKMSTRVMIFVMMKTVTLSKETVNDDKG